MQFTRLLARQCLHVMRLDQDSLVDSGSLFRLRPWGMWLQGEGEMPLKVFNSTTVYLRKDEEWGGGGNRCHPCLNFVVWGIFWLLSSPESCFLTCLIVAACSLCCRYGMSFFDFQSGYLYGGHLLSPLPRLIIYSLYNWCVCEHWSPWKGL